MYYDKQPNLSILFWKAMVNHSIMHRSAHQKISTRWAEWSQKNCDHHSLNYSERYRQYQYAGDTGLMREWRHDTSREHHTFIKTGSGIKKRITQKKIKRPNVLIFQSLFYSKEVTVVTRNAKVKITRILRFEKTSITNYALRAKLVNELILSILSCTWCETVLNDIKNGHKYNARRASVIFTIHRSHTDLNG